MRVAQVGAIVTATALVSGFTHGYTFTDDNKAEEKDVSTSPTSLTANEQSHIFGGNEADISKYPFIVSLSESFTGSTYCTGTLIAPQYILTAGHCIVIGQLPLVATFGSNLSSIGEAKMGVDEGVDIKVVAGYRHPLYNKTAHLYDIGLLKLEKPVKRRPAKLCAADGSDNSVGTRATVLGWGKTPESNTTLSTCLNELTLPVISNAECGKFPRYVGRITEGMMCAGVGDGRDTCNGDSGGPLLVNGSTLIGFVSWGSRCGEQAGVFTRLTHVMDYIQGVLAGGEGSEYGEVEPGSEFAQAIAAAMAAGSGSQAIAPTATATAGTGTGTAGSGSGDVAAMLKQLLGTGSMGAELMKMFGAMGSKGSESDSDSGMEDAELEEDPKQTDEKENSFEATMNELLRDTELGGKDAVSEEGSKAAEDEEETVEASQVDSLGGSLDSGSEETVPMKGVKESDWEEESSRSDVEQGFRPSDSGSEDDVVPVKGAGKAAFKKAKKSSKTFVSSSEESSASAEEDTAEQMDVEQSDI